MLAYTIKDKKIRPVPSEDFSDPTVPLNSVRWGGSPDHAGTSPGPERLLSGEVVSPYRCVLISSWYAVHLSVPRDIAWGVRADPRLSPEIRKGARHADGGIPLVAEAQISVARGGTTINAGR